MAWRPIVEADLSLKLAEQELPRLYDVMEGGIASVTDKVRGYVASSGVEMDPDTSTIPERLIGAACDILVVELYTRLGGTLVDPKGHRKDAKEAAVRLLERVADGKFSIEDPASGSESANASTPTYSPTRVRRFTRESQNGI